MPSFSEQILGPMRARPRRPMPFARGPMPADMPMPPPLVARAERADPEALTDVSTDYVRTILVDPRLAIVTDLMLPIEPGDERAGFGSQITEAALVAVLGSDDYSFTDLGDGLSAIVASSGGDPYSESDGDLSWRFGEDDEPIAGKGVIVGYDAEADAYSDTTLKVADVRKAVAWGDADEDADADESPGEAPRRR
jgi:hypothetical protein